LLAALAPRPRRARSLAIAAIAVVVPVVLAASGYAIHLRRAAERRIDLVSHLRGLAPELRTMLRSAHMLPRHDIRPARERVRSAMREVERQQQTSAGRDETGVIAFVLGEGHRALGEQDPALVLLEQAWAAGERGPQIDAALGDVLGASYQNQLGKLESTVPSSERAAQIRGIEQRYRDPAMAHLRAALAARASSPEYLEALIAFHEHRLADAIRGASAAWAEAPTLYEAGMLEARAHHEAGHALVTAGRGDAARDEFAVARRIFERVLESARSDDDAWLRYGEMVYDQAHDLGKEDLPPDLRQQAIDALRTVRQINPDRWDAILSEIQIYEHEANLAIVSYRDPRPYVERVLAAAEEARAHGAAAARVDRIVCLAYWERAVHDSHRGNPRGDFERAIAACERATAAKADARSYASLGVVCAALAAYEAEHGGDPARHFELGERSFRASLAINDDAGQRYNLGRLWTRRARDQIDHGRDPRRWVDAAIAELNRVVQMDATRGDALAAIGDVLVVRARREQAEHADPRPTIAEARRTLDRALAIDATLIPPIKYRIELAELEVEALLERHADPAPAVAAMQSDAQQLLRRRPDEGFAHRMACRAELLAARSALARGAASDGLLRRAAAEAARARGADPMDASAWLASAEVEQLRAEAARSHRVARARANARGLAFTEQALAIDPGLVSARLVRDALASSATSR
jgi:tetratricopeptide (TPR) repeat protein